ncbi:MAG: helix-turn-helix domain-containing protein [Syntrophomonadaceae bacterium]
MDASKYALKWEDAPDFLKPQEAAKLMRIGRNRIYEYAAMPDFPKLLIGERNFVIPKEALRQWIDSRVLGEQQQKSPNNEDLAEE